MPEQSDHLPNPRIFLCHASEDKERVAELYRKLKDAGYHPWLDKEDLLPGQAWRPAIKKIITNPYNIILVCLSGKSVVKRGVVQQEIKWALDTLDQMPRDTIYLIPVRLEDHPVSDRLSDLHWVDLFEPDGFEYLKRALDYEISRRVITNNEPAPPPSTASTEQRVAVPLKVLNRSLIGPPKIPKWVWGILLLSVIVGANIIFSLLQDGTGTPTSGQEPSGQTIILAGSSLDNTPTSTLLHTPTSEPTAPHTPTVTPTATPRASPTNTFEPPTNTPITVPATSTFTPSPTSSATPTSSPTPVVVSTATNTPLPIATPAPASPPAIPTTTSTPMDRDVPAPNLVEYDGISFIWEWEGQDTVTNENWYFDIKIYSSVNEKLPYDTLVADPQASEYVDGKWRFEGNTNIRCGSYWVVQIAKRSSDGNFIGPLSDESERLPIGGSCGGDGNDGNGGGGGGIP